MKTESTFSSVHHSTSQKKQAYQTLLTRDFQHVSQYMYQHYGIKLPPVKKTMIESRLQKRLRILQIESFAQYLEFVFSREGQEEMVHMIDLITTNKTDFFREPVHFEFLSSVYLPAFQQDSPHARLKVWSAACSSGEELYTLAMVLSEYTENEASLEFSLWGSDLSTDMLNRAVRAVYTEEKTQGIPLYLRKKYLMRAKDTDKKIVRIRPDIRSKANFFHFNLMSADYQIPKDFHIIFCRNVLIYFDRPTQEKVINRLCRHLPRGGYLFLGHSESITDMRVPLRQIRPTIFQKL